MLPSELLDMEVGKEILQRKAVAEPPSLRLGTKTLLSKLSRGRNDSNGMESVQFYSQRFRILRFGNLNFCFIFNDRDQLSSHLRILRYTNSTKIVATSRLFFFPTISLRYSLRHDGYHLVRSRVLMAVRILLPYWNCLGSPGTLLNHPTERMVTNELGLKQRLVK